MTESEVKIVTRTGRPKSENPKSIKLQIRVDENTLQKLDTYAEKLGANRSNVVRKGIELVGKELLENK